MAPKQSWLRSIPTWGWLALLYTVSRLCAYAAGVVWDSTFLSWGWQALDVRWMQQDLASSIWHLHSQPPLFNLLLGGILKLSPAHYDLWLQTLFRLMGLAMCIAMGTTLERLGTRRWVTLAATSLFLLSPSSIVYENWLFYTYPTAFLLTLSAFTLERFVRRPTWATGMAFTTLLVAVVLTRSIFQWFWVVAVLALLFVLLRSHRRALLLGSAAPVTVLVLFLLKNYLLFGFVGTSSWSGMNLGRIAFLEVPQSTKDQMIAEGRIPPVCAHSTFQALSVYRGTYETTNPHPEIPILTDTLAHGTLNFHHWDYVEISRQFGQGSKTMILAQPTRYVKNVAVAASYWFQPPSAYRFVQFKTQRMNTYNRWYNYLLMGTPQNPEDAKPPGKGVWDQKRTITLLTGLLYALVPLVCLRFAWRQRRTWRSLHAGKLAVASFTLFTIAYIFLLSTATEVGENMRFRFLTLPLGWVLLALLTEHLLAARQRRRQRA